MKKAFTLVEMLVAIVLLSLLIGIAVFSLRLQLITVKKVKYSGISKVLVYTQLRSSVESMKHYVVQEYDMLNLPIKYAWHDFFLGDGKQIVFVTQNPIFKQGDALVKLVCKDGNLIYYEEPLYERINFLRPHLREDSKVYTLYYDLQQCSFKYKTKDGKNKDRLSNELPSTVYIELNENMYAVQVKNDYNLSKVYIMQRLYDE